MNGSGVDPEIRCCFHPNRLIDRVRCRVAEESSFGDKHNDTVRTGFADCCLQWSYLLTFRQNYRRRQFPPMRLGR